MQSQTPPPNPAPRRHDTGAFLADIEPLRHAPWTRGLIWARWLVVIAVVVSGAWAAVRLAAGDDLTEAELRAFVDGFGAWGPFVFVAVFSTLGSLIIPTTALTVVGAALFGPVVGFLWSLIGAFIAAMLGFSAARTLGRKAIERFLERHAGRIAQLDQRLAEHGFITAFFMRLLYLPNGLINVVCGVSAISAGAYALATFLGLAPLVFAVAVIAGGAMEALLGGDMSVLLQPEVLFAAVLFLACVSVPLVHTMWQRRRHRSDATGASG